MSVSSGDGLTWTLSAVLDILDRIGAESALFGGMAAQCHGRPRPTWDVDLLVRPESFEAAARALTTQGFAVQRFDHLLKFHDLEGRGVGGDLLSCEANRALRMAFASRSHSMMIGRPVAVISRAAFVALKFEAAATVARSAPDRARDIADVRGVLERAFPAEDEMVARDIAALMYPGAASDLAAFLDEIRHGRYPEIARRAARRPRLLIARAVSLARRSGL